MANSFRVVEHTFPGQHFRELPTTLANSDEDVLSLHAKQYIPLDNLHPEPGDLTILATHGTGFCKEIYEPLWEDLLKQCRSTNVRIRSIWMADIAQQGTSYVMNELKLGHAFSWNDHARDLLQLVNQFRDQFPQPVIGIGHSMGAGQLVAMCSMHPRLLASVAFLDPNIYPEPPNRLLAAKRAKAMSFRKDHFPSRAAAIRGIRKSPAFKSWDPRVLDIYFKFAFRDTPTVAYPEPPGDDSEDAPVTLRTPKAFETLAALRPNFLATNVDAETATLDERRLVPDLDYDFPTKAPFFQPGAYAAFKHLPSLRPRALFIHTDGSMESAPEARELQLSRAGTGAGGSGGRRLGAVKGSFVKGGHLFPFTNPGGTAQELSGWLGEEVEVWREASRKLDSEWRASLTLREKQRLDGQWMDTVSKWDGSNWEKDEEEHDQDEAEGQAKHQQQRTDLKSKL